MRLHEFEAAEIFESMGVPVPRRGVAATVQEAVHVAGEIGYPVMLKAQVLTGSRGLAGGIKTAYTAEELKEMAEVLLTSEVNGLPVRMILVAEKADIARELYVGVTVHGYTGKPVIVVSTEGGVHIEQTARRAPEKIAAIHVDPMYGFYPYQARTLLRKLGLGQHLLGPFIDVITQLYKVFTRFEALIVEINPLAVLPNGGLLALDAVLEIDDSALSRLRSARSSLPDPVERIENPLERRGKEIGVTYVELDGDIALISSGAGLGMASMDIIAERMRPANFLETGGGITADLLYKCMDLVLMKNGIRAVFINVYGGINPIHEGAKGIVRYIKEHKLKIPIVAKALGNRQEETWEILRTGGVHVVTDAATEKAIDKIFTLLEAG